MMDDPSLLVLGLALGLDLLVGEPPVRLHPVVWMGTVIGALARRAPGRGPAGQLLAGAAIALVVPAGFAAAAVALVDALPAPLGLGVAAWLLTSSLAVRALGEAAAGVAGPLRRGDLASARAGLRSLCSRDPARLDERQLAAAAVESVAENASDSVVAPLCWYAVLGLPGAIAYRAINTLDAMIGYRGRHEYLGKAAARLDDLANLIPARLTAVLLLGAGWLRGADVREGWRILHRDGAATASPNAGRPMAAMAGLLRVRLDKPGHYALGDAHAAVGPDTIDAAWRIVTAALAAAAALGAIVIAARGLR